MQKFYPPQKSLSRDEIPKTPAARTGSSVLSFNILHFSWGAPTQVFIPLSGDPDPWPPRTGSLGCLRSSAKCLWQGKSGKTWLEILLWDFGIAFDWNQSFLLSRGGFKLRWQRGTEKVKVCGTSVSQSFVNKKERAAHWGEDAVLTATM